MTQWGPEIELREPGVRLKWLADDDQVRWMWNIRSPACTDWYNTSAHDLAWGPADGGVRTITNITLPADHWAYAPLGAGMEPWAGEQEAAPDDWTPGDPVMWRNGEVHSGDLWNWRKGQMNPSAGDRPSDIIGYKRRSEPVSAGPGEVTQLYWQPWVGCGVLATPTESGEKSDTPRLSDRDLIKALRDDELLTQRLLHRAADRFEQALNAIDALRREFS